LDELDRDHEASEQAEMSASRRKIQWQETVEAEEIDEEKWTTKLKGRSIVSACRFSQGDVNIMENVLSQNGLCSSWIIRCQNESCLPWFQRRFIRREERWPGAKRGRGKIVSGGICWKSHLHAKPKNRNWTSTMIGYQFRMPPNFSFFCFSKAKNWRFVRAFRVPNRQPLDQVGWNS